MMSVLRRNASLENTAGKLMLRPPPPGVLGSRPKTVQGCGDWTAGGGKGAHGGGTHVRTAKRMDQELGFLSGGIMYFKVNL